MAVRINLQPQDLVDIVNAHMVGGRTKASPIATSLREITGCSLEFEPVLRDDSSPLGVQFYVELPDEASAVEFKLKWL